MRYFGPDSDPVGAALAVSWATVSWSTATGGASAVVGVLSGSLSLAGLGVTVLIDVASSVVLIWRFRHQRRGGAAVERAERIAHRVASGALGAFGFILAAQAAHNLGAHARPEASIPAVALAGAGVVVLPVLARWKYRAAERVASPALRADAHITAVGGAVAGVTLAGLALLRWWGWWWADAVAALVVAGVAIRQGVGGLRSLGAASAATSRPGPTPRQGRRPVAPALQAIRGPATVLWGVGVGLAATTSVLSVAHSELGFGLLYALVAAGLTVLAVATYRGNGPARMITFIALGGQWIGAVGAAWELRSGRDDTAKARHLHALGVNYRFALAVNLVFSTVAALVFLWAILGLRKASRPRS